MWYLTKLALKNRAITILLAVMLTGASIWATFQLKLELIPNIEFPYMSVFTIYPDASPDEVADEVTAPIEQVIWEELEGKGLKHVYSTSAEGMSIIFTEFDYGTDMDAATRSVEEGIEDVSLPPSVRALSESGTGGYANPRVVKINISEMMPLVYLTLSGDLPTAELRAQAENVVIPALQQIDGVEAVEVEGGSAEHVLITPHAGDMADLGVSTYQLAAMLSASPRYSSVEGVRNVPLGGNLTIHDVSDVAFGPPPGTVITRTDGRPSVDIIVFKTTDANTVDVANDVVFRVGEIGLSLDNGAQLGVIFDQSEYIEESIGELTQMAIIGAALAIVVVFLFLMAFRASVVTAMSIPLSVIIGFLVMYFFGITINVLTLSAMAIAVGRLIDNSIVVAEVIYRRLQQGESAKDAAINGAREVATPITASTLATVAIFIPLAFVGSIVGEFFRPFGLTVTFALLASLFVALMIVPAFANYFVGRKTSQVTREPSRNTWYQRLYLPTLRWALGHRVITVVVALVLFFGSLLLVPVIGTSFLPEMGEKQLVVTVEMPPGTELAVTSDVAAQVESVLDQRQDVIEGYSTTVGTSTSLYGAMTTAFGGGDQSASIYVYLNDDADLEAERDWLEAELEGLSQYGDITVETGEASNASQMGAAGLDIVIQGEDNEKLESATARLVERLQGIEGLIELESEVSRTVPTLVIKQDMAKAAQLGLTEEQMQQLYQEIFLLKAGGAIPGVSVSINGAEYGIFLKGVAKELYTLEDPEASARRLSVGWPQTYKLPDVAEVALLQRPTHISHTDLMKSASLDGEITARDVGAVNRAIQEEIDALLEEPGMEGVEIKLGGVAEEMNELFTTMGIAIVVAILIAYAIIAVTMRSILNSLLIMVSLPLASIGAFLGLLVSGNTLGMSGMMGMLMLVGIVLTNAIVLVDLVNRLRKEGMNTYDALIEGGRVRLRPILMTAITTMIAMVPLALGLSEGTLIAAELAVVVIGGLFTSTLLTLVVIPVIYSLVDSLMQRIRGSRQAVS